MGLWFPHRAGRCRPRRSSASFPVCNGCTCIEILFIRAWDPVLFGCCWLRLALTASRKSQQPLAWIRTLGSANRMPISYLKCNASSSNAGFMAVGSPLVGNALLIFQLLLCCSCTAVRCCCTSTAVLCYSTAVVCCCCCCCCCYCAAVPRN